MSFNLTDTDYLFWIGNYQNRQDEEEMISWAKQEVLGIFNEPDVFQAILDGKYGISHGAITALALYSSCSVEDEIERQLNHWYTRESRVHGRDIKKWNDDSKMDFLVPLIVTKYFLENKDSIIF